jgi:hypothetical protein
VAPKLHGYLKVNGEGDLPRVTEFTTCQHFKNSTPSRKQSWYPPSINKYLVVFRAGDSAPLTANEFIISYTRSVPDE